MFFLNIFKCISGAWSCICEFVFLGDLKHTDMKRQRLFRAPYLYDNGGDVSKPWWIELGYLDPQSEKMVRRRYMEGFADLTSKQERIKFAEKRIADLTLKLESGWMIRELIAWLEMNKHINKDITAIDEKILHGFAPPIAHKDGKRSVAESTDFSSFLALLIFAGQRTINGMRIPLS